MTTGFLADWVPITPLFYAQPVQCEDATAGLCGAELPDGTGILVWPNAPGGGGTEIHGALVSAPSDFIVDDVVPIGDVFTIDTADVVVSSSVFVIAGSLYVIATVADAGVGYLRLYTADSPTAPTTWTSSVIQTGPADYGTFFGAEVWGSGIPVELSTGRWVLCMGRFATEGGASWSGMNAGAWYSDDSGATWTSVVNEQLRNVFSRVERCSTQFSPDPGTGDLYFSCSKSSGGGNPQLKLFRSTDDGTSFSVSDAGGFFTSIHLTTVVNNGTEVFGLDGSPTWVEGAGPLLSDWPSTGQRHTPVAVNTDERSYKGIITTLGLYSFWLDRVSFTPAHVDNPVYPPLLHIPYKDRLQHLVLDDDNQPTRASLDLAASRDADNLKTIDRWARAFMSITSSPSRCSLFIPHVEYMANTPLPLTSASARALAGHAFDNFKEISRWATMVARGECGCYCIDPPISKLPDRCRLHIPFPDALANLETDANGGLTPSGLKAAAAGEFEAYKAIERWGNRYHSGECICSCV